ncbi:hypothetical protein Q6280_28205, partial [Klebsiella pneumoniae]|uniref:hypothetical protein n=1 Tax=Klebsiella pneumoniae TaxID=573 RepID=UPI00273134DD
FSNHEDLTNLAAGIYTVRVTDAESGCIRTETFEDSTNKVTLVYNNNLDDEFCVGDDEFLLPNGINSSGHGPIDGTWHLGST